MAPPLPRCPHCGALARPNILMFGDGRWLDARTEDQYARLERWRAPVGNLAVIELGAGTDVPSVRHLCESQGAPLVRINPREADVGPGRGVGVALGALEALAALHALLV
jgi:NAD-dependent SIR2 family protein deacetylase